MKAKPPSGASDRQAKTRRLRFSEGIRPEEAAGQLEDVEGRALLRGEELNCHGALEKKALKVMERFRTADSNSLNELLAIIDFHRETDLSVSWRDGLEKVHPVSFIRVGL